MLEELRAKFTLSEYIGRHTQVTKRGNRWVALCPFHSEKTPSFHIDNIKGVYHCFGCGESGDLIKYVMHTQKIEFKEAIQLLADEAGIKLPSKFTSYEQEEQELEPAKKACFEAMLWYQKHLKPEHQKYLLGRGISTEFQQKFQLGFAPGKGLIEHLQKKGVTLQSALEAGLIINIDGRMVERFRQRIMFPIMNRHGEPIAFGGRILHQGEPKYLNSPETPLFKKSHVMYAMNHAKPDPHTPYVVAEGYFDVIALYQAGFKAVVAPLGTALTEQHLQFLWRRCEQPILCFDGDQAGDKAAKRSAELCLPFISPNRSLMFAKLPSGEDPSSFLEKRSKSDMENLFKAAHPLHEEIWNIINIEQITTTSTPEEKARIQENIKQICQNIQHDTIRRMYEDDMRSRFYTYLQSLRGYNAKKAPSAIKPQPIRKAHNRGEDILVSMIIRQPAFFSEVSEYATSIPFTQHTQLILDIAEWCDSQPSADIITWLEEKKWDVRNLLEQTELFIPEDLNFWRDFWLDIWHNSVYKRQVRQEMVSSLDEFKSKPSSSQWRQWIALKKDNERSRS